MAVAFVQSKSNATGAATATTVAVTLATAIGSGNLGVGVVTWSSTSDDVTSVTDNAGNTYTLVRFVVDGVDTQSAKSFYLRNITNGPTTITANFSVAEGFRGLIVHEVSGADTANPLDVETGQLQAAPGTATDAVTSGSVLTTVNGDYIFGAVVNSGGGGGTISSGTNYTKREDNTPTTLVIALASEDQVQATSGSIAATFTDSANSAAITNILTFKAAAVTAGTRILYLGAA